jgi:hypothetical protein
MEEANRKFKGNLLEAIASKKGPDAALEFFLKNY